jgi:anaphase-promoting complex subunit 5
LSPRVIFDGIMPRYLTPSKVGLLALTILYVQDEVPTSKSVAVLDFLTTYVVPNGRSSPSRSATEYDSTLSLSAFEKHLAGLASVMPGRSVYDAFLRRLWSIDCSYALESFFEVLPSLLRKSREQIIYEREQGIKTEEQTAKIIRTSLLGAFIRRCYLEYTRLQFEDSVELWQQLITYRASSRIQYERKNPPTKRNLLDSNLSSFGIDASHHMVQIMYGKQLDQGDISPAYSAHDTDRLLEFQVSEMQSLGSRLPEDMRHRLDDMARIGHSVPKLAHYLKFLDSWRAGDYTSAFDNLHRYFDYTMQSRDRTFYQYALLNLAILQSDFGSSSDALAAMQEAIAIARENKDTTCLNFCMSWLYHFGRTFPSEMKAIRESGILGSESDGLAFLKSRARDAEMWSLLSTSLLSEAKIALQHGDSLATVFESITKASQVNIQKATTNIGGPTLLMRASAFSRSGLAHLANITSTTFLTCYTATAPLEDIIKCACRIASFQASQGRYPAIPDTLSTHIPPSTLRILKYQKYTTFYTSLLQLRRLIRHFDLPAADILASQLQHQDPPDLEISFSLAFLRIELLLAHEQHASALALVEETTDRASAENNDVIVLCRLMNVKARIQIESGIPLKAFSVVTRAAQMAHRALALPALWESVGLLAKVLNALGEYAAAVELMQAILPRVLEGGDCEGIAGSYGVLVDGEMGLAGREEGTKRRRELVNSALGHLEEAGRQYGFAEDVRGQLDCLWKRARVLKWLGDLVLANDVASLYLETKRKFEEMRI